MPLYRKLRGALAENGKRICDLAEYLNVEPMTISQRMVGRTQWRVDEAYKVMDFLHMPREQVYEYFPPEGRTPQ